MTGTPAPSAPQKGFDVLSYSNKDSVNGELVKMPRSTGGSLVMYPSSKGLFSKVSTLSSKLLIGPKSLEGAFKAGVGKGLFGPYW